MAEERLRELERRWKESGSPEDELAYLREVVRTGEALEWESYKRLAEMAVDTATAYLETQVRRGRLDAARLPIAAALGHRPALAMLPSPPPLGDPLRSFLPSLEPEIPKPRGLHTRLFLPFAVALLRATPSALDSSLLVEALATAVTWLSSDAGGASERAFRAVLEAGYGDLYCDPGCCWNQESLCAYVVALTLAEGVGQDVVAGYADRELFHETHDLAYLAAGVGLLGGFPKSLCHEATDGVLEWLLGLGDPVPKLELPLIGRVSPNA